MSPGDVRTTRSAESPTAATSDPWRFPKGWLAMSMSATTPTTAWS